MFGKIPENSGLFLLEGFPKVGVEAPQPVTSLHEVLPDVGAGVVTTPGRRPGCEAVVVQTAGKYPTPVV